MSKSKPEVPGFSQVRMTQCPICRSASLSRFGERSDGIKVLRCNECGMGFVESRPTNPLELYGDAYYGDAAHSSFGYDDYEQLAFHSLGWVVELIGLLKPYGRILDVGSANGHLLKQLGPRFETFGIEVNPHLLDECSVSGIQMLGSDICDPALPQGWDGAFDVITAIAVLEHVVDFRLALEHIRQMLAPGGVLIFEVPLISVAADNSTWFSSSLEHIFYPTHEGLDYVCQQVFGTAAIGSEVVITNYGSTFVGVVAPDPNLHAELSGRFQSLIAAPVEQLVGADRRFRFYFDLVHSAQVTTPLLTILEELEIEDLSPLMLRRLSELWTIDVNRGASQRQLIEQRDFAELEDFDRRVNRRLEETVGEAEERHLAELAAMEASRADAVRKLENQARGLREELAELELSQERASQLHSNEVQQLNEINLALERAIDNADLVHISAHDELKAELEAKRDHLTAFLESTSWRLTAPLRRLIVLFRNLNHFHRVTSSVKGRRVLRFIYRVSPIPKAIKQALADLFLKKESKSALQAVERAGDAIELSQEPWDPAAPLVSVVIPCFNYGLSAYEAVDSVLAQTFSDYEIIVVDGGSDDPESLQALRSLERRKTSVHWREGRHLVGDNRNYGIAQARGKYICCLDADDTLCATYLEKALFMLETQGFDVVSTAYQLFGESDEIFTIMEFPALVDMVRGNHLATCAIFRRSLWEEAGGFKDAGIGVDYLYEDWRLWIRFAALGARIANIVREPLFRYRVHAKSLTRDGSLRPLAAQRKAILEIEQDVLTEEAYRLSLQARALPVEVLNPLENLRDRVLDGRPSILIAVPFLLVGGAERLLSEIVGHLSRQEFRITLVCHLEADPAFGNSTDWFTEATQEIYHLPRFLDRSHWREFIEYLLDSRRTELIWIVGSQLAYDLLPELRSSRPDLRVVDLLFNTGVHAPTNRKMSSYIDLNVVENGEVEQWLIEKGESPDRVVRIPSGVDLERYRPVLRSDAALAALEIPSDAFVVGFSGRLSEEKGPDAFLKIAGRLSGHQRIHFLMTGAGPLEKLVRRQVERLHLGTRVRFLGDVPDVRECMHLYDALVLPSRLDGRPLVVLESLAMGIPVVASAIGGLPELVQEGVTGFLCEPTNLDAFADRILWMSEHPYDHEQMKKAARLFASNELGADAMNASYEKAIGGLMKARPAGMAAE